MALRPQAPYVDASLVSTGAIAGQVNDWELTSDVAPTRAWVVPDATRGDQDQSGIFAVDASGHEDKPILSKIDFMSVYSSSKRSFAWLVPSHAKGMLWPRTGPRGFTSAGWAIAGRSLQLR